jgi:thiamine transport system substrate-binding protein
MKTFHILALALALGHPAAAQQKPELVIYTYDSFVSDWGPGPQIETAFEAQCACDLRLVAAGDGAAVLSRLKLEGGRTKADLVLGLDTSLIPEALASGLFAPHGRTPGRLDLPVAWNDPVFLPYDWGYFAFVYDKTRLTDVPRSLEELRTAKNLSIVIQDPRSSTPGLGLLLWVKQVYGDGAQSFWTDLAPSIVTVTSGWSEAYGMFLAGEADMVLSYTTSPAYHLIAEQDASKAAAAFAEGHYLQIEVAGKLATSDQPALADQFLDFMLGDAFQSVIPTTNWMYPARMPETGLPEGFDTLISPQKALLIPLDKVADLRKQALAEWLSALSQ